MKKFTLKDQGEFYYSIDPKNKPRMYLDIGETLIVETEDASSGQIRKLTNKRDYKKVPYSNPQSGPFYVNGAEKGDTLVVDLLKISPSIDQGITRLQKWWWYLSHKESAQTISDFLQPNIPDGLRIMPIEKNTVYFDQLALPYRPMIGTIGTAPELEAVSTYLPGHHGGNMDLPCVTNGWRNMVLTDGMHGNFAVFLGKSPWGIFGVLLRVSQRNILDRFNLKFVKIQ